MKLSEIARIRLDEIHSDYVLKSTEVLIEEAERGNPYEVGDIIQDHHQIGRIYMVRKRLNVDDRTVKVDYECEKLTKKLIPYKKRVDVVIYGVNVERKLKG